jgi:intracellular multiplication protein IcmV
MSVMAVKDIFKFSRKTFFDPGAWLGLNQLASYTRVIGSTLKTTFTPEKALHTESFEEAMARLNVTESDLQEIASRYRLYTFFFLALSVISFLAGFYYLFKYGTFAGWVLATSVGMLFGANAFRFDFWCFQIKHRKLGCTFDEWWRDKVGSPKDPTP